MSTYLITPYTLGWIAFRSQNLTSQRYPAENRLLYAPFCEQIKKIEEKATPVSSCNTAKNWCVDRRWRSRGMLLFISRFRAKSRPRRRFMVTRYQSTKRPRAMRICQENGWKSYLNFTEFLFCWYGFSESVRFQSTGWSYCILFSTMSSFVKPQSLSQVIVNGPGSGVLDSAGPHICCKYIICKLQTILMTRHSDCRRM